MLFVIFYDEIILILFYFIYLFIFYKYDKISTYNIDFITISFYSNFMSLQVTFWDIELIVAETEKLKTEN